MASIEIGEVTPELMDALSRTDQGEIVKSLYPAYRAYLRETYGFAGMTEKQDNIIYDKAQVDGHTAGYGEVANYYQDHAQFAEKILNAKDF